MFRPSYEYDVRLEILKLITQSDNQEEALKNFIEDEKKLLRSFNPPKPYSQVLISALLKLQELNKVKENPDLNNAFKL